ncbi:hypothetical protein [Komagataeibacter sp. SM21]
MSLPFARVVDAMRAGHPFQHFRAGQVFHVMKGEAPEELAQVRA